MPLESNERQLAVDYDLVSACGFGVDKCLVEQLVKEVRWLEKSGSRCKLSLVVGLKKERGVTRSRVSLAELHYVTRRCLTLRQLLQPLA